jgi:hypothetical protein
MKKLLMAVALVCVLSGTALAGDMPGVNSITTQSPGTGLAGDMPACGVTAPAPSGTESSAVVTVLLTIISAVV